MIVRLSFAIFTSQTSMDNERGAKGFSSGLPGRTNMDEHNEMNCCHTGIEENIEHEKTVGNARRRRYIVLSSEEASTDAEMLSSKPPDGGNNSEEDMDPAQEVNVKWSAQMRSNSAFPQRTNKPIDIETLSSLSDEALVFDIQEDIDSAEEVIVECNEPTSMDNERGSKGFSSGLPGRTNMDEHNEMNCCHTGIKENIGISSRTRSKNICINISPEVGMDVSSADSGHDSSSDDDVRPNHLSSTNRKFQSSTTVPATSPNVNQSHGRKDSSREVGVNMVHNRLRTGADVQSPLGLGFDQFISDCSMKNSSFSRLFAGVYGTRGTVQDLKTTLLIRWKQSLLFPSFLIFTRLTDFELEDMLLARN